MGPQASGCGKHNKSPTTPERNRIFIKSIPAGKILGGLSILLALAAGYWLLRQSGALSVILNGDALREWVSRLGVLGPLAIVGLMAFAILVSPIPSAPIAIAAGAAYGHGWGTLYILLGAEPAPLPPLL